MLVDDEPAAIQFLSTIIGKKCPDFVVTHTAADGQEAIEILQNSVVDVILFDINMPILNGLELSERIHHAQLPVQMVAVSGYSEFEYARQALKNGVLDYLLKPIVPNEVVKVLDGLKDKLDQLYYQERIQIIRKLYHDTTVPDSVVERYFGEQTFYVALVRYNGLPVRFSTMNSKEVFSEIYETIFSFGRDDRENLYIFPAGLVIENQFRNMLQLRVERDTTIEGYHTVVYSSKPVESKNMNDTIKQLYQILNNQIVLGENRTVDICRDQDVGFELDETEKNLFAEYQYCLTKRDSRKAKERMLKLLEVWNQNKRSLLWIERRIRSMSLSIDQLNEKNFNNRYVENENALEEIFANSQDFKQLKSGIAEIIYQSSDEEWQEDVMDTPEFVERVCDYMKKNLDQPLSMLSIGKEFGISQTYLGKLFRKHKQVTLNNFLTAARMEKAKELMAQNEEIMIKALAERLGYKDQFYFSRVFRSYTGVCPSDYIANVSTSERK